MSFPPHLQAVAKREKCLLPCKKVIRAPSSLFLPSRRPFQKYAHDAAGGWSCRLLLNLTVCCSVNADTSLMMQTSSDTELVNITTDWNQRLHTLNNKHGLKNQHVRNVYTCKRKQIISISFL